MAHKFNPANIHKLENPRRKELLPPDKTLLMLGLKEGMHVADIGCGSGYFSIPAAKIVGSEGFVYGTDIYQELVDYCTNRAKEENVDKNTLFLEGQETVIPIPDSIVDVVLIANVVHELLEPKASFQEIMRVLKPGGKVLVIEWKKQDTQMGPPVEERIDAVEAEEMLKNYGFGVENYYDLGATHYAVVGCANK